MKIKLDVWTRHIGKDGKPYTKLHHEEFSEEEILELFSKELKDKYHDGFTVEIDEVTSR